jgi:hypothetical protein
MVTDKHKDLGETCDLKARVRVRDDHCIKMSKNQARVEQLKGLGQISECFS